MHPTLGEISALGIEVRSYQLIRWAYFAAGAALLAALNRRRGIRIGQSLGAFLVGIPAGLVGGHLLNVIEAWPFYRAQPDRILAVVVGGSSFFGALIGGLAAGVAYLRWRRLAVRGFLDAAAPVMALGAAMTRLGCFVNGCCFGHPTLGVVGVEFPRDSQVFAAQVAAGLIASGSAGSLPVHPTQLYSAALSALLCLVLIGLFVRGRLFPGALVCLFLFGYGLQRLVVGWWRADTALYWWELTVPLSLASIAVAAALWLLWRPAPRRGEPRPAGLEATEPESDS